MDESTVKDYDLLEMLRSASEKITTQKLLLVPHSQGNFYANSLYDVTVDQPGGIPKESLGIYSVATPSGRVAGGGNWITSDTDKVIAGLVAYAPMRTIMPPNTHIQLQKGDDPFGHSFTDVYLKYRSNRIVSDIQAALGKLSANDVQDPQRPCIDSPDLPFTHEAEGALLSVADPIAQAVAVTVINPVVGQAYATASSIMSGVGQIAKATQRTGAQIASAISSSVAVTGPRALLAQTIDLFGAILASHENPNLDVATALDLEQGKIAPATYVTPLSPPALPAPALASSSEEVVPVAPSLEAIAVSPNVEATLTPEILPVQEEAPSEPLMQEPAAATSSPEGSLKIVASPPAPSADPACSFATTQQPSHQGMIINEVAWMGGTVSANDEWIELRNVSGNTLDISGWQLIDKDEQIHVMFDPSTLVASGAYVLLERTDDDSVPEFPADVIYTGALSNTDEGLRLFDSHCRLADEAMAAPSWPAGDPSTRKTMERLADLSWHTYNGSGISLGNVHMWGTPKGENSPLAVASAAGGSASLPPPSPPEPIAPTKLLISQVQITGGTGSANDDFIELYNPNAAAVNLNGYRLVKRTKTGSADESIRSWTDDVFIPAHGYYLWAQSGYADIAVEPDITTSATLAADNGIALRYGPANTGEVIDSVAWGSAENAFAESSVFSQDPIAQQSISRRTDQDTNNNADDFMLSVPSPKNSSFHDGFVPPTEWIVSEAPVSVAPAAGAIVFSEIYPDRTGANEDFIELYNSGMAKDISGWSVQMLSGDATSTDAIHKKDFEPGDLISSRGFFLVGLDAYQGADMSWASGSLNTTEGATLFLVDATSTIAGLDDPHIIDAIAYGDGTAEAFGGTALPLPEQGMSWERKAFSDGACISAADAGRYEGNGCDLGNNSSDFEAASIPIPQGTHNLPEPRSAPAAPEQFTANYDPETLRIDLAWDASRDLSGATSTVRYIVRYATSTPETASSLTVANGETSLAIPIQEMGRPYSFAISAEDGEGLRSASTTATVEVPHLLSGAYGYADPRSSGKFIIEPQFSAYPIVPNIYGSGPAWEELLFFKNGSPQDIPYFLGDAQYASTADGEFPKQYGEWGTATAGAWHIAYRDCSGADRNSSAVILPDTPDQCGVPGGIRNMTFLADHIEDHNIILGLAGDQDAPQDGDYFTVAAYGYAGGNMQKLIAYDKTPYPFVPDPPEHQPPTAPENIEFAPSEDGSTLRIIWDAVTDPDTLDRDISYEINYGDTELSDDGWIPAPKVPPASQQEEVEIAGRPFTRVAVQPGTSYSIALRAQDEFGNISSSTVSEFFVPSVPPPYGITDLRWGYLNGSSTPPVVRFAVPAYPFMTSGTPSAMIFFLDQDPPQNYGFSNAARNEEVGGSGTVLRLGYSSCVYAPSYDLFAGLIMDNSGGCTPNSWGLKQGSMRSDLVPGQTEIETRIAGIYAAELPDTRAFTADDYVTIGFYELSGRDFVQKAKYTERIYFEP
ncbi:fibronectin type III domain-containing protein [Patescibacteria group bacterium]|nr:fibronectin type III domain-containing protein [Patescibacteria group bacterium]